MYVRKLGHNQIELQYDTEKIPCEVRKSRRKSYAIEIEPGGKTIVKTPLHPSEQFLLRFFQEKEQWILKKYRKQCEVADYKREHGMTEQQEKALAERYRNAAKEYIPKRVAYYQEFTGGIYERITIREQKTRWGSCSSRGTLSFNWRLMLAPPAVLDYVVVHELCHLTHMNHSGEFWSAVEAILPDYREQRKWLKDNGYKLQSF